MFVINHKETIKNKIALVEINGALDSETATGFEGYIDQLLTSGKIFIIIDAGNLEYVSSVGIGAFIYTQKKLLSYNGYMVIYNLSSEIRALFKLLGFDRIFRMVNTREEAVTIVTRQIEVRVIPGHRMRGDIQSSGEDYDPKLIKITDKDGAGHDIYLEGDDYSHEFESPIILECAKCKSLIRIKRAGKYICPDCKVEFSVDDDHTINF